jgi:prophage regulatory protein
MKNLPSFTLKVINDNGIFESFNQKNPISESQKDLIRFIVRETVQEILKENKALNQKSEHTLYQDRIIRISEVIKITGIGRTSVYKYMNEGCFPRALKLTRTSVGWRYNEVMDWLDKKQLALATST